MRQIIVMLFCFALALAGCGRKGDLEPPPGAQPETPLEQPEE